MSMDLDVVVIGAGAAGLATAAMLDQRDQRVVVFEAGGEPAQSWVNRYEGLHLNTTRWLSDLPGRRMDRSAARFPARQRWVDYLQDYARHHRLDVRCNRTVHEIDRDDLGWQVRTDGELVRSRAVVIATGHDAVPTVPNWDGTETFQGELIHASTFRTVEVYADSQVLVVGTGNSGCEIAALLAEAGADVSLSKRGAPLIVPETVAGVSVTAWGLASAVAPDVVVDVAGSAVHWLYFRDLAQFGLARPERRLSTMRHEYYSPPIDRGIADAVRCGTVRVVQAVERFEHRDVVLADRSRLQPDVVIAATGYSPGLASLVGHLDVLDQAGEPDVYRDRSARRQPDLYFAGFRYGLLALLPYIELDARAIARSVTRQTRRETDR